MTFKIPRYEVTLVRRHAAHSVRERAFDFEALFRSYINAPINVANLPPVAPLAAQRFQMSDGKRSLVAADNLVQLSLDFGTGRPKGQDWKALIEKPAGLMDEADRFFTPNQKGYKSVILQISRPYQGNQSDVTARIAKLFSKTPSGTPAAAAYTYAVVADGITKNLEISQFKFFEFTAITPGTTPFINFDLDFMDPSDEGLQIKVELNSKARMASAESEKFANLASLIDGAVADPIVQQLLGDEL